MLSFILALVVTLGGLWGTALAWPALCSWLFWCGVAMLGDVQSTAKHHAVLTAVLSTYCWWTHSLVMVPLVLSISLGYFMWDIQYCSLSEVSTAMKVHAIMGWIGLRIAVSPFMAFEAASMLMFEWSTPYWYWTFEQRSLRARICFAVVFTLVRLVWGTQFILWQVLPLLYWESYRYMLLASLSAGIVLTSLGLNWYWGCQIILKAITNF